MVPIAPNAVAIVPSVGRQNWGVVQDYPYFAFGIHPWWAEIHTAQDLMQLEYLLKCNNPVAVGECGLDFAHNKNKDKQVYLFETQLKLANNYNLPIIIHAVKSVEAVLFLLKKYPKLTGVIHGFSGSSEQAEQFINRGFYLGFGLQVLNPNALKLHKTLKNIALNSILLETDDHNNPNDLMLVAQEIARLKEISLEKIILQCDNNAISLFGLN
jgi:TatD DNase family protein